MLPYFISIILISCQKLLYYHHRKSDGLTWSISCYWQADRMIICYSFSFFYCLSYWFFQRLLSCRVRIELLVDIHDMKTLPDTWCFRIVTTERKRKRIHPRDWHLAMIKGKSAAMIRLLFQFNRRMNINHYSS